MNSLSSSDTIASTGLLTGRTLPIALQRLDSTVWIRAQTTRAVATFPARLSSDEPSPAPSIGTASETPPLCQTAIQG